MTSSSTDPSPDEFPSADDIPTLTEAITDMPDWLAAETLAAASPSDAAASGTDIHAAMDSAAAQQTTATLPSASSFEQALADLQASIGPASGPDALGGDWRWQLLQAQLPGLFEQALMRVKPQLIQAFSEVLVEALQGHKN